MKYSRQSQGIKCSTCPVKQTCLARDLQMGEMNWLDQMIEYVRLTEPGNYIFKADEKFSYVAAIRAGSCKEYIIDKTGTEHINRFYSPGDIVGLEYIDKGVHAFNVVAMEKTTLCILPIELFNQPRPFFNERVFHLLCHKLRHLQKYPHTTNAKKRVAIFFLDFIKKHTEKYNFINIPLNMSQLDISRHIGIANETLSRILNEFAKKGIIVIKKHCICNYNINLLEKLVGVI